MKRDYYEILGLKEDCNQDEIKVAYRKMALKCHPDKNPSDDAKQMFQELNQANEILSDPNERTWYDSHKNNILQGSMSAEDYETQQTYGFNIWTYFQYNFSGYGDDQKGFFSYYRQAFELIKIREEKAFNSRMQNDSSSDEDTNIEYEKLPGFGSSSMDMNTVLKFYQKWENFTSYQSFSWADKYNPNEGPNRYVKRLIEKDNKKERLVEKKKYIQTIKKLVDTVKNKDPRYKAYLENKRKEEEIQRILKKKQMMEDEENKKILAQDRREAELVRFKENEEYFRNKNEQIVETPKVEKDLDTFFCEACEKEFKSESQMKNHYNSNMHKQNMKSLIQSITSDKREQEDLLRKSGLGVKIDVSITEQEVRDNIQVKFKQEQQRQIEKEKKEQDKKKKMKNKKKNPKKSQTPIIQDEVQEEQQIIQNKIESEQDESSDDDALLTQMKNRVTQLKQMKKQQITKQKSSQSNSENETQSFDDQNTSIPKMDDQKKLQSNSSKFFNQDEEDQEENDKEQEKEKYKELIQKIKQEDENDKDEFNEEEDDEEQELDKKEDQKNNIQNIIKPNKQSNTNTSKFFSQQNQKQPIVQNNNNSSKFFEQQDDEEIDNPKISQTKEQDLKLNAAKLKKLKKKQQQEQTLEQKDNNQKQQIINNQEEQLTEEGPKLNAAKLKKLKKKQQEEEEKCGKQKCKVCQEAFDSKTKLFKHINDKGHQTAK